MNKKIENLMNQQGEVIGKVRTLINKAEKEHREMNEIENAQYESYLQEIGDFRDQIDELRSKESDGRKVDIFVEMMRCPKCDKQIKTTANYCGYCGVQVNEQIVKGICGHINKITLAFFTNCGKEFSKK